MKHPGTKGGSQGEVWKARLEFWASRTFFHNLPAGQCWDGSGCDPWAGTPEDVPGMWGGFSMERQPWSSPCPGIQLGKASLGSPHSWNLVFITLDLPAASFRVSPELPG